MRIPWCRCRLLLILDVAPTQQQVRPDRAHPLGVASPTLPLDARRMGVFAAQRLLEWLARAALATAGRREGCGNGQFERAGPPRLPVHLFRPTPPTTLSAVGFASTSGRHCSTSTTPGGRSSKPSKNRWIWSRARNAIGHGVFA